MDNTIRSFHKDSKSESFEVSATLQLDHYLITKKIVLFNTDNADEFPIASYEEAEQVATLILEVVKEAKKNIK